MAGSGEYEPRDSRNVTGTASTPDGRWTNTEAKPPRADGAFAAAAEEEEDALVDPDDDTIIFELDPELQRRIEEGERQRDGR